MATDARGRFITLEGGEGAGKSTQIKLLAARLRERGIDVVQTREPGGATGAERIRELLVKGDADRWTPIAETLLHYAARADHLDRTIRPALAAGRWVICDRFADSTTAYQGYGHGVSLDVIDSLFKAVVGETAPDLTVILDLPAEQGLQRATGRAGQENRYEQMAVDFHRRLRDGFLAIARRNPQRCAVIDASRALDAVQSDILAEVRRRLGLP
ncbi:MAG TPA: dTMP kinase [Candidatus Acidoferrum sp.]|nr:dTMP kinase [Candidatus Acidoferrum sp.]